MKCPLCSSHDIKFLYEIKKFEAPFKVDSCNDCHFIFQNPIPDKLKIKNMYSEAYYSGNAEYHYEDERKNKKYFDYVYKARIKNILKYQSSGNFLDIGSAFAGLLDQAKKYFTTYGLEVSDFSAKIGESKGHSITNEGFSTIKSKLPYPDNFFSVITLIEVIEHIPYPEQLFSEIYRVLKPGALLVIQTANMSARQARKEKENYHYFLPGHLSYFCRNNFIEIKNKFNFSKMKIYFPVDFGLLPKLQKSRASFNRLADYSKWFKIIWYHTLGKLHWKNFALKSSMVIYYTK